MEQFKKWLEKGESGPGTGSYPRFGTVDEDVAAEKGWRAALERVIKYWENTPSAPSLRCYNQWGKCPLVKRIKKELGDT